MAGHSRDRSSRGRGAHHARRLSRRHPVIRGIALATAFIVAFALSAAGLSYSRFQNNIDTQNIDQLLGSDRPTVVGTPSPTDINRGRALNLLVLGSDSRSGENVAVDGSGTVEGMRSDTTMLVHISADRSHVEVVSIPRDTLVDIPACMRGDGSTSEPQAGAMFNAAFETGGKDGDIAAAAACTIRTVERLTGLYITDFVVVDFAGFINVVDALGGVAMFIPEDVDDAASDLQLEQGCRLLDGRQALGFARVRKSVGDGSDISRISRQQDLVLAIIDEALSTNLLRTPTRLYQFLDTSTQTLTTGDRIGSVSTLAGLGTSLASIRSGDITFVTMPFEWAGPRVTPAVEYADVVWEALRADELVDPIYSGEAWAIKLALEEREAAATATTAAPDPAATEGTASATVTPEPAVPAEDPSICTKETAS